MIGVVRDWGGIVISTALTFIAVGAPAFAQRDGPVSNIELLERIVRAAFPELIDDDFRVVFSIQGSMRFGWPNLPLISLQFHPAPAVSDLRGGVPERPFLVAHADLLPRGQGKFHHIQFAGSYVNEGKAGAVRDLSLQHPNWNDADVAAALDRAGAKYGPSNRDALLRHVDVERYSGVLGRIVARDSRFVWRVGGPAEGGYVIVTPAWHLVVTTEEGSAARTQYDLLFEPFDGRLQFLAHRDNLP